MNKPMEMTVTYTMTVGPSDQDLVNALADKFENDARDARLRVDRFKRLREQNSRSVNKDMIAEAYGRVSELEATVRYLRALEVRRRAL